MFITDKIRKNLLFLFVKIFTFLNSATNIFYIVCNRNTSVNNKQTTSLIYLLTFTGNVNTVLDSLKLLGQVLFILMAPKEKHITN